MLVTIEEADQTLVKFTEKPGKGQSNFELMIPYLISFKVSASDSGIHWETAFETVFTLRTGVELETQSNRLFVAITNPETTSMDIKIDNVGIQSEIELFTSEYNRFLKDHLNLFNEALFEDGFLLPIADYFRLNFQYQDGALNTEINFEGN